MASVGAANTATLSADVDLLIRVSGFLAYEADLLDSHNYDEWHALWTDNCQYWVPANGADTDPMRHVSLIYDDAERLQARIFRLKQPTAYTQDPPARLCRVIGNVRVVDANPGRVVVSSRYVLESVRLGKREFYTAAVTHELETATDRTPFLISKKKVVLTANDEPLPSLLFMP